MKVTLTSKPDKDLSARVQILLNRGLTPKNLKNYFNSTDEMINSPLSFGEDVMKHGAKMLIKHISEGHNILVIVDADCDGFTSAALLINYLYDIFPAFVQNNIKYYIHEGKQHGLNDCIQEALKYDLVICPDSSSNDYDYHKMLAEKNIDVLVLDHHEAVHISEYACIINNQMSAYPNKELSGVGVTWQFCRYLDTLTNTNFAENYYDLVALGLR